MFAIGCIQAQACHTNKCPVGIATQDPLRQRALDPLSKAERVESFHRNTLEALGELTGAAGLTSPSDFLPYHFVFRQKGTEPVDGNEAFPYLPEGFLLSGDPISELRDWHSRWDRASADSFAPPRIYQGPYDEA